MTLEYLIYVLFLFVILPNLILITAILETRKKGGDDAQIYDPKRL